MPIYIYKGNNQISTNAVRNDKAVKAIYTKEHGKNAVCVWGVGLTTGFLTYTKGATSVTITGLKQGIPWTFLIIPDTIENLPVTTIASKAFNGKTKLRYIELPNSLINIGDSAFGGCTGLTNITIPDSVKSIGESAFSGCSSLESITIPFVGAKAGVTSSDTYQYPFGYIFGTSSYTGGVATKQYYYGSSMATQTSTTYYIPLSLKSVTVTGGNILGGAFYGCGGLTSVTIGNGVTRIGYSAFSNCSSLTSIYYTGNVAGWCGISGLDELMSQSRTLYIGGKKVEGDLVIPNGVTSIGNCAFRYCTGLTSVTIGDSVTSIGDGAFGYCTELTSVVIPDSMAHIGEGAFYNTLWHNNLPNGLVYAGKVAYKYKGDMPSNTTIVLEEGTLGIAGTAFSRCTGLINITIPGSVTNIGSYAFSGCSELTRITFNGMRAQWNAISKGTNWNSGTGNYTIHCTDGNISKS